MNPGESVLLHILHVVSILLLTGYTFTAFSAPPESRKRMLMITGICSVVVVLTGLRMWQGIYHFAPLGWIIVKVVCWIGFSLLAGLAYRRRQLVPLLTLAGVVLLTLAVIMVYAKPF